eukprot:2640283-Amphidinium_carterae.1
MQLSRGEGCMTESPRSHATPKGVAHDRGLTESPRGHATTQPQSGGDDRILQRTCNHATPRVSTTPF